MAADAPPAADKDNETLVAAFQEGTTNTGTTSPARKATIGPAVHAPHKSAAAEDSGLKLSDAGIHATIEKRRSHVKATIGGHSPHTSVVGRHLTLVDRYYLAWKEYQTQHGDEPTAQKLSAYLADSGMHGRGGKPVSPSTLRRYFLSFRLYTIWAQHRVGNATPALDAVADDCAAHSVTAQYNKPLTIHDINEHVDDFERRWRSL